MYLKNSITVALPQRTVKVFNRLTSKYEDGQVPDQTFLTPRELSEDELMIIPEAEIERLKSLGVITESKDAAAPVYNKDDIDLNKDTQINREEVKN